MSWVKLDDGYPEHLKVVGLSDAAFRADVEGWCYCARSLSDGLIPMQIAARWPRRAREELVAAGRWHLATDGYEVHDYLAYNPSREQVQSKSDARSSAARSRWKKSKTDATRTHLALGDGTGRGRGLVVGGESAREGASAFAAFWVIYPRRVGKPKALEAFERAAKRAAVEDIINGATRFSDDPNRTDEFTPHPTTWLNRDGWNDPPLPARNGFSAREGQAAQIMRDAIELKRQGL